MAFTSQTRLSNMIGKKHKPKFRRQFSKQKRRIDGKGYRKPRGIYSKQHMKIKGRQIMPSIGYGEHKSHKHMHPSGFKEVLVRHITDLNGLNPKIYALRFTATLGERKRAIIAKKAKEAGFKLLNE